MDITFILQEEMAAGKSAAQVIRERMGPVPLPLTPEEEDIVAIREEGARQKQRAMQLERQWVEIEKKAVDLLRQRKSQWQRVVSDPVIDKKKLAEIQWSLVKGATKRTFLAESMPRHHKWWNKIKGIFERRESKSNNPDREADSDATADDAGLQEDFDLGFHGNSQARLDELNIDELNMDELNMDELNMDELNIDPEYCLGVSHTKGVATAQRSEFGRPSSLPPLRGFSGV